MAQREEGWPLGLLQPLNARIGLVTNRDFSGSVSFSTLLTASPSSSTIFTSDLDTVSTGSFFRDKSISLGSLIGINSFLELSGRSTRRRATETTTTTTTTTSREQKNSYNKSRPYWLFSLCSKLTTDAVDTNNAQSTLRQFLEVERKAANNYRRNAYGPGDFSPVIRPTSEPNSLFFGDRIAPSTNVVALRTEDSRKSDGELFGTWE